MTSAKRSPSATRTVKCSALCADEAGRLGVNRVNHRDLDLPVAFATRATRGADAGVALQIGERPSLDRNRLHRVSVQRDDRNNYDPRAGRARHFVLWYPGRVQAEHFAEVVLAIAVLVAAGGGLGSQALVNA